MGAGDYPDRLRLLQRVLTRDNTTGEQVETFTLTATYFWSRVEEDNGKSETTYGVEQSGAEATIYVRQYPTLSSLDRLVSTHGDTWILDGRRRGDNEWVFDAYRYDELETP